MVVRRDLVIGGVLEREEPLKDAFVGVVGTDNRLKAVGIGAKQSEQACAKSSSSVILTNFAVEVRPHLVDGAGQKPDASKGFVRATWGVLCQVHTGPFFIWVVEITEGVTSEMTLSR
jgi:hypothetical protein